MRRLIAVAAIAATVTTLVVLTTGSADRTERVPTSRQVVGYINHQRSVRGLSRLGVNVSLSKKAKRWSAVLSQRGVLTHATMLLDGWRWAGETLYRGPGGPVRAWLESPPHRQILLDPRAELVGVGRWGDTWTARFAAP